jgi:hypothetical protein
MRSGSVSKVAAHSYILSTTFEADQSAFQSATFNVEVASLMIQTTLVHLNL